MNRDLPYAAAAILLFLLFGGYFTVRAIRDLNQREFFRALPRHIWMFVILFSFGLGAAFYFLLERDG